MVNASKRNVNDAHEFDLRHATGLTRPTNHRVRARDSRIRQDRIVTVRESAARFPRIRDQARRCRTARKSDTQAAVVAHRHRQRHNPILVPVGIHVDAVALREHEIFRP